MKTIKGKMKVTVTLLGSSLQLNVGEVVNLVPATNLPAPDRYTKWYASRPGWGDDAILISARDVTLRGRVPGRTHSIIESVER